LSRDTKRQSAKTGTFRHGIGPALIAVMPSSPAYRQLETWQVAMTLVEHCYRATTGFPREELYGLTSQMRRAAVSIPANVAEGYCRQSGKAYANHVGIALGSHGELETHIELAYRLGFLPGRERERLEKEVGSVGRLLSGLHRSLRQRIRVEKANRKRNGGGQGRSSFAPE